MKIATNTPTNFRQQPGFEFVHLREAARDASMILLMLPANWGSSHTNDILELAGVISSYPEETSCFLVGCEMTMPDLDLRKYISHERDSAIKVLCDEILRRSTSIGVRGEITRRYLIEILEYREDQIDRIFDRKDDLGRQAIISFLQKNRCPLQRFEHVMHEFQINPRVLYEQPVDHDTTITILPPYITQADGSAKLNADILIDGIARTLWCETDAAYADYLLVERSDAFLCAILPFAMRARKDIECLAPVTEQFLHNLTEILIPQLCAHDDRLYAPKIIAAGDASILPSGNGVATGMSAGVDSFYTTSLYYDTPYNSMKLTHLYTGNYLYGNGNAIYERARHIADDLGLPIVCTGTNLNEALNLHHLYTHFFKTMFGVLSLRKLFRVYYYSSAEDFSHFSLKNNATADTAIYELLLLYVFSCADFQVVTGGGKSERLEKTRAIADFGTARKYLNVCLDPKKFAVNAISDHNCGKCGKCKRTMLMLDMLGSLDLFCEVFDVDEYRRTRVESFKYLAQEKDSIMLAEVYQHFSATEPELVAKAEALLHGR